MKKALSQEEARVSPRWGTGVELRSAGGPWSAQQRRTNSEVFGPTVKEEAVQGVASNGTSSGMVIVTPSGTPKARISMSSMDRGREDYINQFSERVGQKNFFLTYHSHCSISDAADIGGVANQSRTGEHLQQRTSVRPTACG